MTVHRDIAVGAVGGTLATTDAVVFDDDLFISFSENCVDWASHKAVGIGAGSATGRYEKIFESKTFADQTGFPTMSIGTGFRAFIAASTGFEIENEQALSIVKALRDETGHRGIVTRFPLEIQFQELVSSIDEGFLECGIATCDSRQLLTANTDQFHVVQGCA
jgi:hypothetical protein